MNRLPFLKNNKVPRLFKGGISEGRFGFSEEEELKEKCMDELMQAIENKDHNKLMESILAIIDMLLAKEDDATDAHEVA